MRRLFVVICLLLVYGSLYPWRFRFGGIGLADAVVHVFHSWRPPYAPGMWQDITLNIVVYIPLGLIGYLASKGGFRWSRIVWPVVAGGLLSLSVETIQNYVPSRVPSAMDLACNTLGSAAGVAIGILYEIVIRRVLAMNGMHLRRSPSSALMMLIVFAGQLSMPALLIGYEWFTRSYTRLPPENIHRWNVLASSVATWLMAGRFLEVLLEPHPEEGGRQYPAPVRTAIWLVALLGVILFIRITAPMSRPEVAGAAGGIVLYLATASLLKTSVRDYLLAGAGLLWLVGDGLRPYHFNGLNRFEWIPFLGMLSANWILGVMSLLNKVWMYGCAFWVWERAGLSRPWSACGLLVVLGAIEYAQLYLPGRVSTMTDLAMGAIAAGLLWGTERKYGL